MVALALLESSWTLVSEGFSSLMGSVTLPEDWRNLHIPGGKGRGHGDTLAEYATTWHSDTTRLLLPSWNNPAGGGELPSGVCGPPKAGGFPKGRGTLQGQT